MHASAARRRHRRGRAAPPSRREQAALRASASQVSAAGAIVESALSGAGGASEYGAIVASATSGVDAGAAAQQWQHRCVNPSQISSSGSLGDLGSGGGAERRARLNAAKRCLRRRGSGSSLRLACCRVCVSVCVCGWRVAHTPSCGARTLSSRAVRQTHNPSSLCLSPLCCVRVVQRPPRPYLLMLVLLPCYYYL